MILRSVEKLNIGDIVKLSNDFSIIENILVGDGIAYFPGNKTSKITIITEDGRQTANLNFNDLVEIKL
jgi:hypothetical protein